MTMVERVGARICQIQMDHNGASDFFVRDEATGEYLIEGVDPDVAFDAWRTAVARAAIEAMAVPTPAMGVAAYVAWDAFGDDATMGPQEVLAIWRAMITAALAEREEGA